MFNGIDKLDAAFELLQNLPPDEQSQKLAELYPDNPGIIAEVKQLLKAARQSPDFLSRSPFVNASSHQNNLESMPIQIGPYAIRRKLGEGGMGCVYLAERVDGEYNQLVAIKIAKNQINSHETEVRFKKERQILADLNNSHIARLIDGGRTSNNQPYFIMEYIRGSLITDHVKINNLTIQQIVSLFIETCEAVKYAHEQGIIHRDLKPGNILIDINGKPKLLDFGIAKLLHDVAGNKPKAVTEIQFMTPEYASPEIIKGEELSASSDIYALGIILYEIITGMRPYDFNNKSLASIVNIICDEHIRPPSLLITHKVNKPILKLLDRIVLKCLEKSSVNRYQTVNELINDLNQFKVIKVRSFRKATTVPLIASLISTTLAGMALYSLSDNATEYSATRVIAINTAAATNKLIDTEEPSLNEIPVFSTSSIDDKHNTENLTNSNHLEKLFSLKTKVSNNRITCIGSDGVIDATKAMQSLESYQCNILKAFLLNQQQKTDEAMKSLLTAREYFSAHKQHIKPHIKAWMYSILSETRAQSNDHQKALLIQNKAVRQFRLATDNNNYFKTDLINALNTLALRFEKLGKYQKARVIHKRSKQLSKS